MEFIFIYLSYQEVSSFHHAKILIFMKNRILIFSSSLFLLFGCGSGESEGTTPPAPFANNVIIVTISASASEVEVGQSVEISHSVSGAVPNSCIASGDWSGSKSPLGNTEEVIIAKTGTNTFTITCSAPGKVTGSATVNVTGLVARIDITNSIFSKRSNDCSEYVENYSSNVRDLTRALDFDGYVDIGSTDEFCEIYSDNIPNHDFNDSSAGFAHDAIEIERIFQIKRSPQQASQNSPIMRNTWDAIMLNGVVVDLKSAGCYSPTNSNANPDGNIPAGCNQSAQWNLVPLEYKSMFKVDIHNAHVQGDGTYHYHGNPNAMFDDSPSGDGSPLIGFAADGFPIYGSYILDDTTGSFRKALSGYTLKEGTRGSQSNSNPGGSYSGIYEEDWEWTDAGDLDECNGMTFKGSYGYYVTDGYPYILNCFKGTIDSSFQK